jgi:hypothetical protein
MLKNIIGIYPRIFHRIDPELFSNNFSEIVSYY